MAVPADKKLWRVCRYFFPYGRAVLARIAAYMRNPYIHILTKKAVVQRKFRTGLGIVYVAVHSPQWLFIRNGIGNGKVAYVACVPYLIGLAHILQYGVVYITVGIRKQQYLQNNNGLKR